MTTCDRTLGGGGGGGGSGGRSVPLGLVVVAALRGVSGARGADSACVVVCSAVSDGEVRSQVTWRVRSGQIMTSLSGVGPASVIVHGHTAQQVITSSQQPSSTVGESESAQSVGSVSLSQSVSVSRLTAQRLPVSYPCPEEEYMLLVGGGGGNGQRQRCR